MERKNPKNLGKQIKKHSKKKVPKKKKVGNTSVMISTGSTLLDLAISGGIHPTGGLCGGIMVEISGLEGSGKTVLLCEIAGGIQRKNGAVLFEDPEARLNTAFAQLFDFKIDKKGLHHPNLVSEFFASIRKWKGKASVINGIFGDSLAALSTKLEMDDPNGDKMGMRRAKEFSEGFRKIARILKSENHLMVCSNQVRENAKGMPGAEKWITPGGKAVAFYSSVRLRNTIIKKIKSKEIKIGSKTVKKLIGIILEVKVIKNSIDAPYRTAPVYILFDYGIDDIRANLQYLKDYSNKKKYFLNKRDLKVSLQDSIEIIEKEELEKELKKAVINLWNIIESKLKIERKKKRR